MGRVLDVIFYSEMLVVFYLFVIDPIVVLVQRHDGCLPLLAAIASRLHHTYPPPSSPPFSTPLLPLPRLLQHSPPPPSAGSVASLIAAHLPSSRLEHDYARLAAAGGSSGHISIEMGERRGSDVSDDTL
jgi:hypothetical protein